MADHGIGMPRQHHPVGMGHQLIRAIIQDDPRQRVIAGGQGFVHLLQCGKAQGQGGVARFHAAELLEGHHIRIRRQQIQILHLLKGGGQLALCGEGLGQKHMHRHIAFLRQALLQRLHLLKLAVGQHQNHAAAGQRMGVIQCG